jgi:hypothetical protein
VGGSGAQRELVMPMDERARHERRLNVPAQPDWSDWERWADSRIAAALDQHKAFQSDVIAHVIAELQKQFEKKIKTLQAEVGELRTELNLQRAHDVVDFPSRKRIDAA